MPKVDLTDAEKYEVEATLLRERVQLERIRSAEMQVSLLREHLAYVRKDKDLLFLRLITEYALEDCEDLRFGPEGKTIEWKTRREEQKETPEAVLQGSASGADSPLVEGSMVSIPPGVVASGEAPWGPGEPVKEQGFRPVPPRPTTLA